jgi:hypothetical protein
MIAHMLARGPSRHIAVPREFGSLASQLSAGVMVRPKLLHPLPEKAQPMRSRVALGQHLLRKW